MKHGCIQIPTPGVKHIQSGNLIPVCLPQSIRLPSPTRICSRQVGSKTAKACFINLDIFNLPVTLSSFFIWWSPYSIFTQIVQMKPLVLEGHYHR
jgi:hypothetical protein